MVVGLLVFSLVELMGSAVVDFAVLVFRSIVEILSFLFHFHHHFQQCKKREKLSTTVANILQTLRPLLLLSLLSWIQYSSTSCKSTKESWHPTWHSNYQPFNILSWVNQGAHHCLHHTELSLWWLITSVNSPIAFFCFLSFSFSVNHLSPMSPADIVSLLIMFQCKHAN